jgi:hypothetical protein
LPSSLWEFLAVCFVVLFPEEDHLVFSLRLFLLPSYVFVTRNAS